MRSRSVVEVLDLVSSDHLDVWLHGGWGVDALLGYQTRVHDDLDLLVRMEQYGELESALTGAGYELSCNLLPKRAIFRRGCADSVDVHPLCLDCAGVGWQPGGAGDGSVLKYPRTEFVLGTVRGRVAPCISASLQVAHRMGYRLRLKDAMDLNQMSRALGTARGRSFLWKPAPYPASSG